MFCSRVENLDLKLGKFLSLLIYTILAEIPGVAREIKKTNFLKKGECLRKKGKKRDASDNSVQPFGQL